MRVIVKLWTRIGYATLCEAEKGREGIVDDLADLHYTTRMAAVIPLNGCDLMPAGPAKGAMILRSKVAKSNAHHLRRDLKPALTGRSDVKYDQKPKSSDDSSKHDRARSIDELKALVSSTMARSERVFVDEAVGDCEPSS